MSSNGADEKRPPKIAMVVSRFPKVTETFQLREMLALQKQGVDLELFAIIHMPSESIQDDVAELDARANYIKFLSLETLRAQAYWLRTNRAAYIDAWKWSLKVNARAPEFLIRTPMVVMLAAAMAIRMQKIGIEHVHAHYATYPTHCANVIKMLTGLTYSFTGHAHDLRLRTDGLGEKIEDSEFYFTCTQFAADDLRSMFGSTAEKGKVVYHGVDINDFAYCEPNDDDGERPIRIVCVASFEECKGHRYLIEAIADAQRTGRAIEARFIGGNLASGHPYQEEMMALAQELGVDSSIEFMGRQPSHIVRESIEWSDFGALAACRTPQGNMDGLPNTLTECLAMGRPVVSTTMPGVMELVVDRQSGLLVRSRDAAALADAIVKLGADRESREAYGRNGRETVEEFHNVHVNTRELYDTYVAEVGRPHSA